MSDIQGVRIHVTGIIQGVGFRPFIYGLATRLGLFGWVRNTSAGVDIEVEGANQTIELFLKALKSEAPPLARIDDFAIKTKALNGFSQFEIIHSESIPEAFQPISPDVCICPDCLKELFDPINRRFRYPFINCTNCGPRFTIIQDIPYDRPETTMSSFQMCERCRAEYQNPTDRRFHAQPIACPDCGPQVWLEFSEHFTGVNGRQEITGDLAIQKAQKLLAEGKIVAIKGLGGFHLACDATSHQAVSELRKRKYRVDKPFAVMIADLETAGRHCLIKETEIELLTSRERPVVILPRRPDSPIAPEVTPNQETVGVMLPYTPLHYLLLSNTDNSTALPELVMTSGNLSEEPIATENDEARTRLAQIADAFLMHDRPIHIRCDDSVVRTFSHSANKQSSSGNPDSNHSEAIYPIRRSRGYAPLPLLLSWDMPPILATGSELKNSFCITRSRYAILSHHIGDMENYETLLSFETGIAHFERLFRIKPEAIAYDLHPNYLPSRYAIDRADRERIFGIGIQHHHAHVAACMAENHLPNTCPVIGISFDGTGYGEDGAIWGGEILIADYAQYVRPFHLKYVPLPGGDASIKKPGRIALSHLWAAHLDWEPWIPSVAEICPEERTLLRSQLEHCINSPYTSSVGRLFDAVSSLVGIRHKVNFEAQAAIELEALVDQAEVGSYPFSLLPPSSNGGSCTIDPAPMLHGVLSDLRKREPVSAIAARFHNGVANVILKICNLLRAQFEISDVALSGGVWQNMTLLKKVYNLLVEDQFEVYIHRAVPTNDGGISLGQAIIGYHRLINFEGPLYKIAEINRQPIDL